jgi:MSHA biogenesis protein MshN
MSIINRMLQDLDRRQGLSDPDATTAIPQVRSVGAPRGDREWFWRIVAVLLVAAVGWVAWIAWQLQPRPSLATDLAIKSQTSRTAPSAQASAAQTPPPVQAAAAPPEPKPAEAKPIETKPVEPKLIESKPVEPKPAEAKPTEPKPAPPMVAEAVKPPAAAVEAPKPEEKPRPKTAAPKPQPAPGVAAAPAPKLSSLDVPPARILQAPAQPQGPAKVEKRDRTRSAPERAESEFRRGVGLLNQGRTGEAEEAFAAALAASPAHEPARQALVAMALEHQRVDEARRLLQEGVALNAGNVRFASVLARIHIERKDYAGALEVLNGVKAPVQSDSEFQAMRGTALQRLGRHAEAVEAFQAALRGGGQNGALWIGLGVSLEALGRRPEAAEAFQRAAATGTLSTEARNYAEQRARQLQ